eukprot:PhM_4_TR5244/c0_g1_i1/m.54321
MSRFFVRGHSHFRSYHPILFRSNWSCYRYGNNNNKNKTTSTSTTLHRNERCNNNHNNNNITNTDIRIQQHERESATSEIEEPNGEEQEAQMRFLDSSSPPSSASCSSSSLFCTSEQQQPTTKPFYVSSVDFICRAWAPIEERMFSTSPTHTELTSSIVRTASLESAWVCTTCGCRNNFRSVKCIVCDDVRQLCAADQKMQRRQTSSSHLGRYIICACGAHNKYKQPLCLQCGRMFPLSIDDEQSNEGNKNDDENDNTASWMCELCRRHNVYWHRRCTNCHHPREEFTSNEVDATATATHRHVAAVVMFDDASRNPAIEWTCACGEGPIGPCRSMCPACTLPRPPASDNPVSVRRLEPSWRCELCHTVCYETDAHCRRCRTPQSDARSLTQRFQEEPSTSWRRRHRTLLADNQQFVGHEFIIDNSRGGRRSRQPWREKFAALYQSSAADDENSQDEFNDDEGAPVVGAESPQSDASAPPLSGGGDVFFINTYDDCDRIRSAHDDNKGEKWGKDDDDDMDIPNDDDDKHRASIDRVLDVLSAYARMPTDEELLESASPTSRDTTVEEGSNSPDSDPSDKTASPSLVVGLSPFHFDRRDIVASRRHHSSSLLSASPTSFSLSNRRQQQQSSNLYDPSSRSGRDVWRHENKYRF